MEISDLELFIALSKDLNMTKTADRLYIAQSSVSYRLKNLEQEFGVPLVTRGKSGILLTSEGKYFLQYAQTVVQQYHNAKNQLQSFDGQIKGELRIGVASVLALNVFPQILKSFYKLYPNIEIYLRSSPSNRVDQMLERNEISAVVTRGEPIWGEEKYLLYEEPVGLVSTFPLNINSLVDYPFLSHPHSNINTLINAWWRQNFSVPQKTIMEVDNTDICLKMLLQGLGWTILPAVGLADYPSLYFKTLTWSDGTPLTRKTYLLVRTSSLGYPLVQILIRFLKNNLPACIEKSCIQKLPFC